MQEPIYNPEQVQDPLPTFQPLTRYYTGNPDKGGQPVADIYDILKENGHLEELGKMGFVVNPTHDFDLLKGVREGEYRKAAAMLHAEYIHYGKQTTKRDFVYHRLNWLQDELTRNVEGWISKNEESRVKRPKHLVELNKYRDYVIERIKQVEQALRPHKADTQHKPNTPPPINYKSDPNKLTARERTLIICYEAEKVINKGEPDYNDYITFATRAKRIAYPSESKSKAKSLITSIRKILPKLSEKARQQAENELNTIESKIV